MKSLMPALRNGPQFIVVSVFILSSFPFLLDPVGRAVAAAESAWPAGGDSTPAENPFASAVNAPAFLPVPAASFGGVGNLFIGQDFTFSVSFDNTSPTDVGYGPFIDVYFPETGADGDDGILFDGNAPTYLGVELEYYETLFPDDGGGFGTVSHPIALDINNDPIQITGRADDRLVTVVLPFGSFTPDQPPVAVSFGATLSELADLDVFLSLYATGGFFFGADPLDNPCCDPTIYSPPNSPVPNNWTAGVVEPQLLDFSKEYNGPEDETATGPNFPRQYTLTVTIAENQSITDLRIVDTLPDTMQFVGLSSILVDGTPVAPTVNSLPSTLSPGGVLDLILPGAAVNDVVIMYEFYIPRLDAGTANVLHPDTGGPGISVTSDNLADILEGDWDPLDPRDPDVDLALTDVCPSCPGVHTLELEPMAIQKGQAIVDDVGAAGLSPGDTIEYTIDFQISDFFALTNLQVVDVISDGQHFDFTFPPTLLVGEHGLVSGPLAFDPTNFAVTENYTGAFPPPGAPDGTTTIDFFVSAELITRAFGAADDPGSVFAAGDLLGGCVPPNASVFPPDCSVFNAGATTGRIVFRAVVQEEFTDIYLLPGNSGDPSVDQGDVLSNEVDIYGNILENDTGADTGNVQEDDSASSESIAYGALEKSVYAVNGTICPAPLAPPDYPYPDGSGCEQINPGDVVTYRFVYQLPTTDIEDLVFTDYIPLPVFSVTDPDWNGVAGPAWTFDEIVSAEMPAPGAAKFGPTETLSDESIPSGPYDYIPTISIDATNNSIEFDIPGNFDDPLSNSTTIDILFSLVVTDLPFADGLKLTNAVYATQGSTNAGSFGAEGIIQIRLGEPELGIQKGVVASSNPAADFDSDPPAPVVFNAPGTAGQRWAPGTIIGSNDLAGYFESSVEDVTGGDLVTFAVVLENIGSGANGAFDIVLNDILPAGFVIPLNAAGLNLNVTRGDGTPLQYRPIGDNSTHPSGLFDDGIEILDPGEVDLGLSPLLDTTFGVQPKPDEGANGDPENESIGRCVNGSGSLRMTGSYANGSPTPGSDNDCSLFFAANAPFFLINELNSDDGGAGTGEFIELYDGGRGNLALTGLVLVLYDGNSSNGNEVYRVIDLDGYFTDANGFFVIGGTGVAGADLTIGTNNWLQDGADAAVLYQGVPGTFPTLIGTTPLAVEAIGTGGSAYLTAMEDGSNDGYVYQISASNQNLVNPLQVGDEPRALGLLPSRLFLYVANTADDTVTVVDTLAWVVDSTIPVGNSPQGVAVNPAGTRIYISNFLDDTVSVINTTTNAVIATINVGDGPLGLAVSPDGAKVYVANSNADTLSVINTASNTVSATIGVGDFPRAVTFLPDGSKAYVANGNADDVSVIDVATDTNLGTDISVGDDPSSLDVSGDGLTVFVTNEVGDSVSVIDTATDTVSNTIAAVGGGPLGVAVAGTGEFAFTANSNGESFSIINLLTETVTAEVSGRRVVYSNILDALVYDTGQADNATLLTLVNVAQPQINEDQNDSATETVGRCTDGSGGQQSTFAYVAGAPTPGANNDCTPLLIINEIDSDTLPLGSESSEFIEIYDGGVGNTALDGFMVVLWDGHADIYANDNAYALFDLTGYTTDANGYFVIGGRAVAGIDARVGALTGIKVNTDGWLQNGTDAVALYTFNELSPAPTLADFDDPDPGTIVFPDLDLYDAVIYDSRGGAACQVADPSNGANVVIITYDLQVASDLSPGSGLSNLATLVNYSNSEDGEEFLDPDDEIDASTSAELDGPGMTKAFVDTNVSETTVRNVNIGEIITYQVDITVPQGQAAAAFRDLLDAGLAFVDFDEFILPAPLGLIINEVDADSDAGADQSEFIELFDGGVGGRPLDGTLLVLYDGDVLGDGSGLDAPYRVFDLDGYKTDGNGYFIVGGTNVPGIAARVAAGTGLEVAENDWLQDGADAVALMHKNYARDFPYFAGSPLTDITAAPGLRTAFATGGDDDLFVIDTENQEVLRRLETNADPLAVAFSPGNQRVYVVTSGSNEVQVFDMQTGRELGVVALTGADARALAVTPDGTKIYVANFGSDTIDVIDSATLTVAATIVDAALADPAALDVTPDGSRLYIVNQDTNSVAIVDTATDTVAASLPVGSVPTAVAIAPFGNRAHVTNSGSDDVTVIRTDTEAVVVTYSTGTQPSDVVFNPAGTLTYVLNMGGDEIQVHDTASGTLMQTISLHAGYAPERLTMTHDGTGIYVMYTAVQAVGVVDVAAGALDASTPLLVGASVPTTDILDAFVYDTDDADDVGLLTLITGGSQQNENTNAASETESSQRCYSGSGAARSLLTYAQHGPTPGAVNACGAVSLVMINEVDAVTDPFDQNLADTHEFVELFDGGSGNTALDNLWLVFYEGGADLSYDPSATLPDGAVELTGLTTDAGGYFVLGGSNLAGIAERALAGTGLALPEDGWLRDHNTAQTAYAVALYLYTGAGVPSFPAGTAVGAPPADFVLVDALVYTTNGLAADAGLTGALLNGGEPQVDEADDGDLTGDSMQRCANGTGGAGNTSAYAAYVPSPGGVNRCADNVAVLINEVDAQAAGGDTLEFIELYAGQAGQTDLSGYSVVLFDGSSDAAYAVFDLDGYLTDSNGYFLLGNAGVAPEIAFAAGTLRDSISHGANAYAVALYRDDFTVADPIVSDGLHDLVVYSTTALADDDDLLAFILSGTQLNENGAGGVGVESIQRCLDGMGGLRRLTAFEQATASPRAANCASLDTYTSIFDSARFEELLDDLRNAVTNSGAGTAREGRLVNNVSLGIFSNNDRDNSTDEVLSLVYRVVVNNTATPALPVNNVGGENRNNSATFTMGSSTSAAAQNATVREPVINVTKTSLPVASVDAGDIIRYTVTITPTTGGNTSTAFNLEFSDVIPNFTTYYGNLDCTAGAKDPDLYCHYNPDTDAVEAAWSVVPNTAGAAVISFDVRVVNNIPNGTTIENEAMIAWTSLPGNVSEDQSEHNQHTEERTATDAYETDVTANVSPVAFNSNKQLINTSEGHTTVFGGVEQVAIGEIVRYRLEVLLPEANITNLVLRDNLPAGLQFLNDGTATVAFVSNGSNSVVALPSAGAVDILDNVNGVLLGTVGTGGSPQYVATLPDGSKAYVTDGAAAQVFVIDPLAIGLHANSPIAVTGGAPSQIVMAPDGSEVYVLVNGAPGISRLDTATDTETGTIALPGTAGDIALSPDGQVAYVTLGATAEVYVFNLTTNAAVATIPLTGTAPAGIAVNPLGTLAFVANTGSNNVSVIDLASNTEIALVALGVSPLNIAMLWDGSAVYVTAPADNAVAILNASAPYLPRLATGAFAEPSDLRVINNTGGTFDVFVTNAAIGVESVSVIESASESEVATYAVLSDAPLGLNVTSVGVSGGITSSTLSGIDDANLYVRGNDPNLTPAFSLNPDFYLAPDDTTIDEAISAFLASHNDVFINGTDVFFKLGDVSNNDDDLDDEYIVIEFNALVLNATGNQARTNGENGDGLDCGGCPTVLSNTMDIFVDAVDANATSGSVDVEVSEPFLTIGKAETSGAVSFDAGDAVQYTLTITNPAISGNPLNAYNVRIEDHFDANLILQDAGGELKTGSYSVEVNGLGEFRLLDGNGDVVSIDEDGDGVITSPTRDWRTVPLNGTWDTGRGLLIDFPAAVGVGTLDSLDYTAQGLSAAVTGTNVYAFDKAAVTATLTELTDGETFTVEVAQNGGIWQFRLLDGALNPVEIDDDGDGVGIVITDAFIDIPAGATWNTGLGLTITFGSTFTAGQHDSVGYTRRATANEVTGNNVAAFAVSDTLQFMYIGGDVSVTFSGAGQVIANRSDDAGGGDDILDLVIDIIEPGETVTIVIDLTIVDIAVVNLVVENESEVFYQSIPGPHGTPENPTSSVTPGEPGDEDGPRNGDDGDGGNDDYQDLSNVVLFQLVDPFISKYVESSTDPNTIDPVLVIGEEVTFELVLTLPEGLAADVLVRDYLPFAPGRLEVLGAEVISIGANIVTHPGGLAIAPASIVPAISDSNADLIDDEVEFDFGTIHNVPNGVLDSGDVIVMQVTALVLNHVANQEPQTLENLTEFDIDGVTYTNDDNSARVEVVEQQLTVDKTVSSIAPVAGVAQLGSTVTYEITIQNGSTTYVSNSESGTVDVISDLDGSLVATINVGGGPQFLASSPGGGFVYVANGVSVQVIDTTTNAVVGTLALGGGSVAQHLAVAQDLSVIVTANIAATLTVIDLETLTETGLVALNDVPGVVAIAPDSRFAYATIPTTNEVAVVDLSDLSVTYVAMASATAGPLGIAVHPNGTFAYVANGGDNTISVIDLSNNTETAVVAGLAGAPSEILVLPDGSAVVFSMPLVPGVGIINPTAPYGYRNVNDVAVALTSPTGLGVVAVGGSYWVYAGNFGEDTVAVIDMSTEQTTGLLAGAIGDGPLGITLAHQATTAFNLVLEDFVPDGMDYVTNSAVGAAPAGWTVDDADAEESNWLVVPLGGTWNTGRGLTIEFETLANLAQGRLDSVTLTGGLITLENAAANVVDFDIAAVTLGLTSLPDGEYVVEVRDNGGTFEFRLLQDFVPVPIDEDGDGVGTETTQRIIVWTTNAGVGLGPNETAVLPFSATIPYGISLGDNVPQEATLLLNAVRLTWASLETLTGEERDGEGGVDDFEATNDVSITVTNPDLRIEKTDNGVGNVAAGAGLEYVLDFFNDGNATANDVILTETVPDHTIFSATATDLANGNAGIPGNWYRAVLPLGNPPVADAVLCADGDGPGTICVFIPDVGAGAGVLTANDNAASGTDEGSVHFVVTLDNPLAAGADEVENTASIDYDETGDGPDPSPENNETTVVTTTAAGEPDMVIQKADGIQVSAPDETIVYTLSFDNVGTQDATGVVLWDTIPAGAAFDPALSTGTWYEEALPATVPPTPSATACDASTASGTVCVFTPDVGDGPGVINAQVIAEPLRYTVDFALTVADETTLVGLGVTDIRNRAEIGDDGANGPDENPSDNVSEDEDALAFDLDKTLIVINEPPLAAPIPAGSPATIGTLLTYEVTLVVPGSNTATPASPPLVMPNFLVADSLEHGLAFMDCVSVTVAPGVADVDVTTDYGAGFADLCAPQDPPNNLLGNPRIDSDPPGLVDPLDDDQGRRIEWDFGTLTNNTADDQTITITYRVAVLDNAANVRGVTLTNEVDWTWNSGVNEADLGPEEADEITIMEPDIDILKEVDITIASIGQIVTFDLTVEHTGDSDATGYEIIVLDTLPAGLSLVPGSWVERADSSVASAAVLTLEPGNILRAEWPEFQVGDVGRLRFRAVITFFPPGGISNTASVEWSSFPGDLTNPQSTHNSFSTERFYDPPDDINIYGGVTSTVTITQARGRGLQSPATGFAPDVETVLPQQPAESAYQEMSSSRLVIPQLGVDLPIVGVPFDPENGWDVTWLGRDGGWLQGTAGLGEVGNTFITAHVYDADGNPGPFVNLHKVGYGETFELHLNGWVYTYQVVDNRVVLPNDSSIYWHDAYDRVTLLTCLGYNEATGTYSNRVAVQAILVSVTGR